MAEIRLTGPGRAAIRKILTDSEREHGAFGRLRYAALIEAAFKDVEQDPFRPSARRTEIDGRMLLTYHLARAKHRVSDPPGRVQDPPHAIVYEVADDGVVDIYGLIHERMERDSALRRLRTSVLAGRRTGR